MAASPSNPFDKSSRHFAPFTSWSAAWLICSGCSPWLDWVTEGRSTVQPTCLEAPRVDAATAHAADERIRVPETDVRVVVSMDAEGAGTKFVGSMSFHGGVGQLDLGCQHVAAAVYSIDRSPDWTTLSVLAVAQDRLYPVWLNCSTEDNRLQYVSYTGTDGTPYTTEVAHGQCIEGATTGTHTLLPAIDMPLPRPLRGYTIDTPSLSLTAEGRGTIIVDGVEHSLLPFGDVDCSSGCASSFRDVHALVWNADIPRVSFATLNLRAGADTVRLWSITLPDFVDTIGQQDLPGTFTTP